MRSIVLIRAGRARMGTIHRNAHMHLNECILAIKGRLKGSRLPSEEEVLIIRPTGEEGQAHVSRMRVTLFNLGPCQEGGIPKQDPSGEAVRAECGLC